MTSHHSESKHPGITLTACMTIAGGISLFLALGNTLFIEMQLSANLQSSTASTLEYTTSMEVASAHVRVKQPKREAAILQSIEIDGMPYKLAPWHTPTLTAYGRYSDKSRKKVPVQWKIQYGKGAAKKEIQECNDKSVCKIRFGRHNHIFVTAAHEYTSKTIEKRVTSIDKHMKSAPAYKDEVPSWAEEYVRIAGVTGVMSGYEDGRFGPADPVTNAQFATLVYRAIMTVEPYANSGDCPGSLPKDMTKDHFAYKAFCFYIDRAWSVKWALDMNAPMSRREAAIMINEGFGDYLAEYLYGDSGMMKIALNIPDIQEADADLVRALQFTVKHKIMGENGTGFNPDSTINRAETAAVVSRMLDFLIQFKH